MKSKYSTLILGIDPGLRGAVAYLGINEDTCELLHIDSCPVLQKQRKVQRNDKESGKKKVKQINSKFFDKAGMLELLRNISIRYFTTKIFCVLERAQAMQDQGVVSTFTNGVGYGYWEMALVSTNIPYISIHPSGWARAALKEAPEELEGKERTIWVAKKRFPYINFIPPRCRVPNDGWADAANIAYYGYLKKIHTFATDEFDWCCKEMM